MAADARVQQNDPQHHATKIKRELTELIGHLREDTAKVDDPKAQAMFETTAEVLIGLRKAFEDYERRNELAWKRAG